MFEMESESLFGDFWAILFITHEEWGRKGFYFHIPLQSGDCSDIDMLPDIDGWLDDFAENEWYPADISEGLYHLKLEAPPEVPDWDGGIRVLKATRLYDYQPKDKEKGI